MATDVGVGDIEIPYLDVTPGDATTAGTLTAHPPQGDPVDVAVAAGAPADDTVRLTADPVTYTVPGRWVLHWAVTGAGAGAEDQEVYVVAPPTAGGPTWTPGRSRVANYVPGRTLVPAAGGANTAVRTFDSTTNPPGIVVDRLIADAVAWVLTATGTVDPSLHDMAAATAAVWAAAMVEQGYPDRDAATKQTSADTAAALLAQARTMRDDLARANAAVSGTNPNDPAAALLPRWSFPPPVVWGDELL
jgi:hypothetical protein